MPQKKDFSDFLLEKKTDAEVSKEINKLGSTGTYYADQVGSNQNIQGGVKNQMTNQTNQFPQQFQNY